MTMTLASATPVEVDTALAELSDRLDVVLHAKRREIDGLHHDVGDIRRRGGWGMTDAEAIAAALERAETAAGRPWVLRDAEQVLARVRKHEQAAAELRAQIQPLNALWDRLRWSRFFLAKSHDGHVHSSEACSTCHNGAQRTAFAWQPHMSGKTEGDAVAEYGRTMCTVCFPSAPADPRFALEPRAAREARAAKEAEQARKQAERDLKGITNPDGSPLVIRRGGGRETVRTLVSAQRAVSDLMWWEGFSIIRAARDQRQYTPDRERLDAITTLIVAIAHKTGRNAQDVRNEYQAKADKKIAKDLKG